MLLAIALAATLHAATAADSIKGNWQITGDVAGNEVNSLCAIVQTGAVISGTCTGATGQPMPITGTAVGDSITFQHGGDYQGQELTIIYTGKLESAADLKGTIYVKPFDVSGTFTAKPAPATPAAAAPSTSPKKP